MRTSVILFALLASVTAGCNTMAGAAFGQVLCGARDDVCRRSLLEQGAAADSGTVTFGGEQYAASRVFDCETFDGRHVVIESNGTEDASYTCVTNSGAQGCSCVSVGTF